MTYPVGLMILWHGAAIPEGWLEANGQSTGSYTQLAGLYGANLPDMTDGKTVKCGNTPLNTEQASASVGGSVSYTVEVGIQNDSRNARGRAKLNNGGNHSHTQEYSLADGNFNFGDVAYHGRDGSGPHCHRTRSEGGGTDFFVAGRVSVRHYHGWDCTDSDPNSKDSGNRGHDHRVNASFNYSHDHSYNASANLTISGTGSTTRPNTVSTRYIIKHD